MLSNRSIIIGLLFLCCTCAVAQSRWDEYANVQAAIQSGEINIPEVNNYKLTIGQSQFNTTEISDGDSWVYYLIKWSLSPQQLNTRFTLRDTLDAGLDGSTVTMIASSNPYQISANNPQIFSWSVSDFAASENGANKEGHVYFKVRIKPDVKAWTVIRNTAFLELQNGEVIATTTAAIQIVYLASVADPKQNKAQIFPNPIESGSIFNFTHPLVSKGGTFSLFDAYGRAQPISCYNAECILDPSLSSGWYQVVYTTPQNQERVTASLLISR
jgi:fimbrial isopeptide formation D2 family protein